MSELLRPGDHSPRVSNVQARLREFGYQIDDEDSHYGDSTARAVRTFQQARNILVDGIVGPHTWTELQEALFRLGDRVLYAKQPPIRGDDVVTLQQRLNGLGFDSGREDGIYGKNTAAAVRLFQKEYGVSEDGIFGPRTHAALIGLRVDVSRTASALREELRRVERSGIHEAAIAIDPGHGGADSGEVGRAGLLESEICWDVANRLAERLIGRGAKVLLTRDESEGPDNTERARRANDFGADLLISIHLNAHDSAEAGGSSSYYFGVSKTGQALAENIQDELIGLGARDCRAHARSYPILKETRMPAVLVEPAFVTNPEEEKRLDDHEFRNAIADAIVAAIQRFFAEGR